MQKIIPFIYIYGICNTQKDLEDLLRKLQTNALMQQKGSQTINFDTKEILSMTEKETCLFPSTTHYRGLDRRDGREREGVTFTNVNSEEKKLNNKHTPLH